ncbi:hypothetical protein PC119_g18230 [Phytophthora cactorum]|uniref:Uncharacterized protein n=1 Tax=Phytophthora cactorum TaxID=29920 RepID=A0A8T0YHG1_9STRA|nr:hypothetical protein PC113_g18619 [Phytophthora cactorum]KAG2994633.1 hypothetical protein PC119_g18230 [Phytophthora cactorum]KAG3003914.1 hypothetical protein PC120_g18885 [Phytophthora cactorum]KAG3138620.1 hypothetical protein C6341_g20604 [Phytophthora cactorum]KAG3170230.1 hypothetical protein PC128_g18949 [Phytophthora cactorum]
MVIDDDSAGFALDWDITNVMAFVNVLNTLSPAQESV